MAQISGHGICEVRNAGSNLDALMCSLTENSRTGAPFTAILAQKPRQPLGFEVNPSLGFTLLEILLVVVIVAITTAVAIPNLFSGPREQLRSEARQLLVVLNAARDEAALGGRVIGIAVSAQKIEFFERDLADANRWSPSGRESLQPRAFPPGWSLRVESANDVTRLAFLPAGVSSPFTLALSSPAGVERIGADALGNLSMKASP